MILDRSDFLFVDQFDDRLPIMIRDDDNYDDSFYHRNSKQL